MNRKEINYVTNIVRQGESNLTREDLLTTYKVLGELMETNDLTMDNSFVRVRNKIANMMMQMLLKETNNG